MLSEDDKQKLQRISDDMLKACQKAARQGDMSSTEFHAMGYCSGLLMRFQDIGEWLIKKNVEHRDAAHKAATAGQSEKVIYHATILECLELFADALTGKLKP